MTANQLFLETYKKLENMIRKAYPSIDFSKENSPVTHLESSINVTDSEKLRICRNMRNFLQHNEKGSAFITVTDEQIKFLNGLIEKMICKNGIVKDKYKTMAKSPFVHDSDTVQTIAKKLTDSDVVIVFNKKEQIMGYITTDMFIKAMSGGIPVKTKAKYLCNTKTEHIGKVQITDGLEDIDKGFYLVYASDTLKGSLKI